MKCKCKICNKSYMYGDKNSPMLIDKIWNSIVRFYKLEDFEKRSHLFICSDCMEKALDRHIKEDDLVDPKYPFNDSFRKWYFK